MSLEPLEQLSTTEPNRLLFGCYTRLRFCELLLVLSPFLYSLVISVLYVTHCVSINVVGVNLTVSSIGSIIRALIGIVLLLYILNRQGRSLWDICKPFEWIDLLSAFILIVVSLYLLHICKSFIYYLWLFGTGHALSSTHLINDWLKMTRNSYAIYISVLLFGFINPFSEELAVRGYLITDIKQTTRKVWLAILISTVFQCSYHLYQGVLPALSNIALFGIFSVFYVKTGKLWPVILAHMFYDIYAIVRY